MTGMIRVTRTKLIAAVKGINMIHRTTFKSPLRNAKSQLIRETIEVKKDIFGQGTAISIPNRLNSQKLKTFNWMIVFKADWCSALFEYCMSIKPPRRVTEIQIKLAYIHRLTPIILAPTYQLNKSTQQPGHT